MGRAAVSLTAFSFTELDTNSILGVTLRAALHRTTAFELRVVDGTLPPPVLLTTNMGSVPVGMTFMNPLFTTNGVRPLKFEQIGGSLPPGMALEAGGTLTGQTASEGTFDATVRMTDLIGRVSTQALRVVTVPPPASVFVPWVENVGRASRTNVVFDVVGGSPDGCVVEYSTNLLQWTTFLTTNASASRLTLQIPDRGQDRLLPRARSRRSLAHAQSTDRWARVELQRDRNGKARRIRRQVEPDQRCRVSLHIECASRRA